MNSDLSYIPVSLASLSWWGTLGIEGCSSVHLRQEDLCFLKPLRTCDFVLSLTELTARVIHSNLKSEFVCCCLLFTEKSRTNACILRTINSLLTSCLRVTH